MSSESTDQESLLAGCEAGEPRRSPEPRHAVVLVEGPDAPDFLHRLCSQEVLEQEPGRASPAAFLDPKGKLVAISLIARADNKVFVETPSETAEALHELLDRYHFTEDLRIEKWAGFEGSARRGVEVLGAGASAVVGVEPGAARHGGDSLVVSTERNGVEALRLYGAMADDERVSAVPVSDQERVERLRILSGLPTVGIDSEPTTLGLEADLEDHVSTTKGCYTGQEIVARIHTYGHVNRKLTRLLIAGEGEIEKDTPICTVEDGAPLGRVTSAIALPDGRGRLGLGYLPGPFLEEPEPIAVGAADGASVQLLAR
ncbi:MAG: hypothetical protein AAF196_05225 [Planctomycetota bacterium]